MRLPALIGVVLTGAALVTATGCGGGDDPAPAPLGSPQNPIPAQPPRVDEATSETAGKPGFEDIVDRQRAAPARDDRENPCAWVTKAQAQAITGARLLDPVVAPQGPTCIYRDRAGETFTTVAIQPLGIDRLRPQVKRIERVDVAGRVAYCGIHGQPVLYLPLAGDRVLSVTAQCATAARFARRAAAELLP